MAELVGIFFQDDLNVVLSLLAGVALVGYKIPRRRYFALRLTASVFAVFCWSLFINSLRLAADHQTGAYGGLSVVKFLVLYVLTVLAVVFCLRCPPFLSLFFVTIAYCLEHISQRLMGSIRLLRPGIPIPLDRFILLLISVGVFGLMYWRLLRPVAQAGSEGMSDNRLMVALSVCVVCMDIVINTYAMGETSRLNARNLTLCIYAFSIVCSFMALLVSLCQTRAEQADRESEVTRQLLYSERSQYLREKAAVDAINIKCHDLKHQIAALDGRVDPQELSDIQDMVGIYDSGVSTGNAALDIVLSNKSLLCLSKRIAATCIADGKRLAFMSEADTYSLFSNIMDNAIEAVERLEDPEKRVVCLNVTARNSFILIHQENYYEGELTFADGLPQTVKEDKQYHGFGMRSIRSLTEKYGGNLHLDIQDGVYVLDILLPIEGQAT